MNEFRVIGEVSNVKPYHFPSGTSKVSFTLKAFVTQKKFTFLSCESWNKGFVDNMVNGMIIELTNYIPQTQSWKDQNGNNVYRQVLVVQNFALIQENSISEIKEVPKQVASVPKQEFNPQIENYLTQENNNLDWMEELDKIPSNSPQPQIINQVEQAKSVNDNLEQLQQEIAKEESQINQFTYEQLLELNKPYQHGTIEKPPLVANEHGDVKVDTKYKDILGE